MPDAPCALSVVLPAYQEGAHLAATLDAIERQVTPLTDLYELLVVDDGSPDDTWDVLRRLHHQNARIRAVRLSRNFGKEAAVAAGLEQARGEAVLLMDADGQHPPDLIPVFWQRWRAGHADVIEGVKRVRDEEHWGRRLVSRGFHRIARRATGIDFANASDYKLLSRRAVEAWRLMPERRLFFRGMSTWVGFSRERIAFDVAPRRDGRSRWSTAALLRLGWAAILSYSVAPLRLIHAASATFLLFAFGLTLRALWLWWRNEAVGGITTVVILVLLVGGLVLLSLGLIAEYVAAIYEEVKQRPRYVVADRL